MTLREIAEVCQRLAETQQNMAVPMTSEERRVLREAAKILRGLGASEAKQQQQAMDRAAYRT